MISLWIAIPILVAYFAPFGFSAWQILRRAA